MVTSDCKPVHFRTRETTVTPKIRGLGKPRIAMTTSVNEAELHRRRLDLAAEAAGLGFWEYDLRAKTLNLSDKTRDLLGLDDDEPVDFARFVAAVHPEDRDRVVAALKTATLNVDREFRIEHRVAGEHGPARWLLAHGRVLTDELGASVVMGASVDISARRAAEESRALVIGELAHRAKNGLTVMAALVHQTARTATSVEEYEVTLLGRIQVMARSQSLLTETDGGNVDLQTLAREVLAGFDLGRFDLDSRLSQVRLEGDASIGLGLLLYELATNATKHGALSSATGRVRLRCSTLRRRSVLRWREVGGPTVTAPARQGFGSRLIASALRQQGGKVEASFRPTGFVAVIQLSGVD